MNAGDEIAGGEAKRVNRPQTDETAYQKHAEAPIPAAGQYISRQHEEDRNRDIGGHQQPACAERSADMPYDHHQRQHAAQAIDRGDARALVVLFDPGRRRHRIIPKQRSQASAP